MIRHPMQKCPAKFVPVFLEILENSYWGDDAGNHFICLKVKHLFPVYGNPLRKDIVRWIETSLEHMDTFNHWLRATSTRTDKMPAYEYVNQCRKAWLEWLVSPEGHFAPT